MRGLGAPSIFLIATLDTKAEEARFLRDSLLATGLPVQVIDVGVRAESSFAPDITREEVAATVTACSVNEFAAEGRAAAVDVMSQGAAKLLSTLHRQGKVAGVLAMGGSGGTTIGTAAMRALPLGVPKLMLSTMAAGDVGSFVGMKDICMMHSVVDFSGVNPILEPILRNAAAAIAGMAEQYLGVSNPSEESKKLVAASMFGVTTPCVNAVRSHLKEAGLELVPFHATGSGGRTMEALIEDGFFCAVLDITTTEWADEVVGGTLSAGPTRLEAAAHAGLPQVVVPGALDMVNFVGQDAFPQRFRERLHHQHNQDVVLMRTNPEECREIGRRIAQKLNAASGPTTLLYPTRGLSALDGEGGIFDAPEADQALLESLREHCRPPVEVRALEFHINDEAFAEACCQQLLTNIAKHAQRSTYAESS